MESLISSTKSPTSHQHAAGLGPLAPPIRGQDAHGRQLFVFAGSHPADLVQLSQQVSLVQTAEVYHHVQDKELHKVGSQWMQSIYEDWQLVVECLVVQSSSF